MCCSRMHPPWHLITFKCVHRAHQQFTPRHARDRDLSPSFCTPRSLTLFDPAKFPVDLMDFSQLMYPFVKSFDASAQRTC